MSFSSQGSPAWHEWRRERITASRVAAIMGEDPWSNQSEVYLDMVEGRIKDKTEAMTMGTLYEPYARRAYEDYMGIYVDPMVVEHPEHKFLGASLDGINFEQDVILEIKCPGENSYQKIKDKGVPRHYWIQMQAQMFCVPEAKEAHFFAALMDPVIIGRIEDFILIKVPRDDKFHVELLAKCKDFWDNHIVPRIPPLTKYTKIRDEEYWAVEERLQKIMELKKKVEEEEEDLKQRLIVIADGECVEGRLTRVNLCSRKGAVDEKRLKDDGISIDDYRKPSKSYQTVTFIKAREEG